MTEDEQHDKYVRYRYRISNWNSSPLFTFILKSSIQILTQLYQRILRNINVHKSAGVSGFLLT